MSDLAVIERTAMQIYQDLLDEIGMSYGCRDFDAFARVVHVPYHFTAADDTFVVRDHKGLRRMFEMICDHLAAAGVDLSDRVCTEAKFIRGSRLEGTHISRYDTTQQNRVRSVLLLVAGRWMVCASDNTIKTDSGFCRTLHAALKSNELTPQEP